MNYIQLIGLAAGALTTSSLLPQVIKSFRTKSTKDISLGMFILISTGNLLWLTYGLLIRDIPVIVANLMTFLLSLMIIMMKIKYK
ncbi:MAG: SemiSWEET transporter [Elusimicrobiota bacterium]